MSIFLTLFLWMFSSRAMATCDRPHTSSSTTRRRTGVQRNGLTARRVARSNGRLPIGGAPQHPLLRSGSPLRRDMVDALAELGLPVGRVLTIDTDSVRDFMRMLLVTEPHFPPRVWYFRGQSDATWGLVPSLFRRKSWDALGGVDALQLECADDRLVTPQANLEFQEQSVLKMVANIVDRMGLPLHLKVGSEREAFAQHIGLPTRLLDWSRSPWTAAYFAAAGAGTRFRDSGRLAVFAISSFFVQHSRNTQTVEELVVAAAGNPNLVAQQGVLIRVSDGNTDLLDGQPVEPLTLPLTFPEDRRMDRELMRITLPWSESLKLLRTLREQDIHGAVVYPGQTGVATLVRELFLTDANPNF